VTVENVLVGVGWQESHSRIWSKDGEAGEGGRVDKALGDNENRAISITCQ
jgi:hypothetical protein